MHYAVFSFLMALVTTCVTALAASNLPTQATDDEQPAVVQPFDDEPAEGASGAEAPFEAE